VCALVAKLLAKPHHRGLGHDCAAGELEIPAHALGVDLEPFEHGGEL
jgi:hypothetical protein